MVYSLSSHLWYYNPSTGPVRRNQSSVDETSSSTNDSAVIYATTIAELSKTISSLVQPASYTAIATITPTVANDLANTITSIVQTQLHVQLQPIISQLALIQTSLIQCPTSSLISCCVDTISTKIDDLYECLPTIVNRSLSDSTVVPTVETPTPTTTTIVSPTPLPQRAEVHPNILCNNRFEALSDDSESEYEATVIEEIANTRFHAAPTKKNKAIQKSTAKTIKFANHDPLPDAIMSNISNLSEAELLDQLRLREVERKHAERPAEFLTDEEKKMNMDQLFRKWKLERQRERQEREELRKSDFDKLGDLDDEQRLLPRRAINALINARKNEVWAKGLAARGIKVLTCEVCSRLYTEDREHRCLQTRWRTDSNISGVSRNIILTQSPSGVRMRTASIVDEAKVFAEYERLKAMKEAIEAKEKLVRPNVPTDQQQSSSSTNQDVPMASVVHASPFKSPSCV
jgi:hypothetical protein